LNFVALREERYDLVIMECDSKSKLVSVMLEAIDFARFASEHHQLCAYDKHDMGQIVAGLR